MDAFTHSPETLDEVAKRLSFAPPQGRRVDVVLRIRPGRRRTARPTLKVLQKKGDVEATAPKSSRSFASRETGGRYSFTEVCGPEISQKDFYAKTLEKTVTKFIEGNNGLVFAYGVTNAGKTYTVEGSLTEPGLIPRALEQLFKDPCNDEQIFASYLQVYNEKVYDLQENVDEVASRQQSLPRCRASLKVKANDKEVEVKGLVKTELACVEDGLNVLKRGRNNRETHGTRLNANSSRSHSVFCFHRGNAKLFVVDLAGSERNRRTGTSSASARRREASKINQSLGTLMRCLETLRNSSNKIVPFRDNKLTLLFRDCFVGPGASGVTMIVNASPDVEDYDETIQVLKFGAVTRSIDLSKMTKIKAASAAKRAAAQAQTHGGDGRRLIKSSVVVVEEQNDDSEMADNDDANELTALRLQLEEAHDKCAEVEQKVRAEVANEMTAEMERLEQHYAEYIDTLMEKQRKTVSTPAPSTLKELRDMAAQIEECEKEMGRMRKAEQKRVSDAQKLSEEAVSKAVEALLGSELECTEEMRQVLELTHEKGAEIYQKFLKRRAAESTPAPKATPAPSSTAKRSKRKKNKWFESLVDKFDSPGSNVPSPLKNAESAINARAYSNSKRKSVSPISKRTRRRTTRSNAVA